MWQMRMRAAKTLFARSRSAAAVAVDDFAASTGAGELWISAAAGTSSACVFAAEVPSNAIRRARAATGAMRYCAMRENLMRDRAKKTSIRTSKFHNNGIRISSLQRRYAGYGE